MKGKEEHKAMMCSTCGYVMDTIDAPCPRCQGHAQATHPPISPPPAPMPALLDIDHILVDAIGRVGVAAGGLGGGIGARYMAQRLSKGYHRATWTHGASASQSVACLTHLLQARGEIIESTSAGNYSIISAVVGSGFMNLNPCVLVFIIAPASATSSTIEVMGYAKEGLINQRTAEKAVNAVLQQLPVA